MRVADAAEDGLPADQDDPTRPVTSVDLRTHFEDDSTAAQNDRLSLIFRGNFKWDLAGQWKLAARLDLPLTFSDAVSDTNPDGRYRTGLGRPLAQLYLADVADERWAFAFGSQIVGPASSSVFGSGNWEIVPIAAFRYMLPEITPGSYFVGQVRYALSFAQSYAAKSTANLQLSPQLKIALPQQWFIVLFPSTDIRINFGEKVNGQTGRLFLPLDGEIGRNIADWAVVSVELSAPIVQSYPLYRLKIDARLSLQL